MKINEKLKRTNIFGQIRTCRSCIDNIANKHGPFSAKTIANPPVNQNAAKFADQSVKKKVFSSYRIFANKEELRRERFPSSPVFV